jgi:cytochrome c1
MEGGGSWLMKPSRFSLAAAFALVLVPAGSSLAEEGAGAQANSNHPPEIVKQNWSFAPPFGTFDHAQLQRGFQVYKEVCSNCHSMRLLSYRNLGEPGGPQFSPKAVKVLASQVQVSDGPNDKGEMFQRPARPSDRFHSPFANDQLARAANNGALPPDLSVIAKAREGGPDYIYALLTGYRAPPTGFEVAPGMHYNAAFPGHQVAMPPPLSDGVIAYTDGTKPTVDNYARDVSAYLMWAAEPKLEERHKTGTRVMIFLIVFLVIMYLAKRSVWAGLHHRDASRSA